MTAPSLPTKEVYRLVGQQIRKERVKRHMTQEDLASRVGLTRTSVTNIEKGRQKVLLHTLFHLAEVLGVELGDLLSLLQIKGRPLALDQLPPNLTPSVQEWILSGVATAHTPPEK